MYLVQTESPKNSENAALSVAHVAGKILNLTTLRPSYTLDLYITWHLSPISEDVGFKQEVDVKNP